LVFQAGREEHLHCQLIASISCLAKPIFGESQIPAYRQTIQAAGPAMACPPAPALAARRAQLRAGARFSGTPLPFPQQIVWHVLQEDWRLLLVTPTRFRAKLNL
jgi:hypothetical protein